MKKTILLLSMFILTISCTKDTNDDKPITRDSIFGSWQLVEQLVGCSDVVGQESYWEIVENGIIIKFNQDLTYFNDASDSCCNDSENPCIFDFSVNTNNFNMILMDSNCSEDFDNEYEEGIYYFENNNLILAFSNGTVSCPNKYQFIED